MLRLRALPLRSLRFHWRGNLAVVFGAAVGAAVLSGALFVGDSLRGSLRERSERQLNGVTAAWTGSRLIRAEVSKSLPSRVVPAVYLQGSVSSVVTSGEPARLSRVSVIGLDADGLTAFGVSPPPGWADGKPIVAAGPAVADALGVSIDGKLRVSVQQFSAVPRSSLLGRRAADDATTALTLTVATVLPADAGAAAFSLVPNATAPLNLYVPLAYLQERLDRPGRANALFALGGDVASLNDSFRLSLTLADIGLRVHVPPARKAYISVESEQFVLDLAVVDLVRNETNGSDAPTSVYLANGIAAGGKTIPYSVVAALPVDAKPPLGPFLPPGVTQLADDQIVLTDWDESPLKDVPVGSKVTISYFKPEVEAGAEETTATFTLAGRVPLSGVAADPDLTPPFPGVTDKKSIGDWNPPFPFDNGRIKPNDANERFWNKHKTTPKAYITLAAGTKLFGSRFGSVTSIRVPGPERVTEFAASLQKRLPAEQLGLTFDDVRGRLLSASRGGTDFGGLFLGFSLFLIASALLLVGLMFRLNAERRAAEVGSLLAAGFTPRTVRRLFLAEGLVLTIIGGLIGVALGVGYSRLLVFVLTDLWPDPTVKTFLRPHATPTSAALGFGLTVLMSLAAVWLAVRGLSKVPPPALLRGQTQIAEPPDVTAAQRRRSVVLAVVCGVLAVGSLAAGTTIDNPDFRAMSFFTGGGLMFAAGLLLVRRWLRGGSHTLPKSHGAGALLALGPRNAGRFPGRSVLTVFLIGAATFLLVAVESFRRQPDRDFADRTGGSGGFNLLAEADVPLFQPFDTPDGRADLDDGLRKYFQDFPTDAGTGDRLAAADAALKRLTAVVPLRLRAGDDASCLNLYQASRPRAVGVPDALVQRGGFRFAMTEASTPEEKANPWLLLAKPRDDGAVPVFAEQNTAMWMLKVGVGGELDLPDESGASVKCRLVGTLMDSVFQSELLMADARFRRLYPRDEGFRLFLLESPPDAEADVRRVLETGLRANGLTITPARDRVAAYQAVIGTYLTTFQLLGGLGLFLGVLGLAAVVLRGVWERVGEFALLRAVGYTPAAVRLLVLGENLVLLALGLLLGLFAAAASVAPHMAAGGRVPWLAVAVLTVAVTLVGTVVVYLATATATRIPVLAALRGE